MQRRVAIRMVVMPAALAPHGRIACTDLSNRPSFPAWLPAMLGRPLGVGPPMPKQTCPRIYWCPQDRNSTPIERHATAANKVPARTRWPGNGVAAAAVLRSGAWSSLDTEESAGHEMPLLGATFPLVLPGSSAAMTPTASGHRTVRGRTGSASVPPWRHPPCSG
jgi:hypothetical protein